MQTNEDGGIGCVLRVTAVRYLDQDAVRRLRLCFLCASPWPKARRLWCSDACRELWYRNHWWTVARDHAIRRSTVYLPLSEGYWLDDGGSRHAFRFTVLCDECGALTSAPEVNHVEPRRGGGYGPGCHHHQTNLQVLDHGCHATETTRQRREAA